MITMIKTPVDELNVRVQDTDTHKDAYERGED